MAAPTEVVDEEDEEELGGLGEAIELTCGDKTGRLLVSMCAFVYIEVMVLGIVGVEGVGEIEPVVLGREAIVCAESAESGTSVWFPLEVEREDLRRN